MSFHNTLFPVNISWGSRGGPRFKSNVVELPSGGSYRESLWTSPIYMYDARYGVATHTDMYDLIEFIIAREGPIHTFPFKDHRDYASTATGTLHYTDDDTVDDEDVEIGVGDGVETQFQLVKKYVSGSTTRTRNIYLPYNYVIAVDGVSQTEGVDFTMDTETGVVTFMSAPTGSLSITAGFEFYVKCRFGAEIDDAVQVSLDEFDSESLPSIPIVEDIDGTTTEDEYLYGGGYAHGDHTGGTVAAPKSLGLVQTIAPQSGATVVQLPLIGSLQDGGPHLVLGHAGGAGSLTVKDNALSGTVTTLSSPGDVKSLYKLGSNGYVV